MKNQKIATNEELLASLKKEFAQPRVAESVRAGTGEKVNAMLLKGTIPAGQ